MTQEAPECGQVHHVEERTGELVVACGDGPVDLQMTDQALDVVALPIDALVPADRRLAVRTRRDHRPDANIAEAISDGVTVVALVGQQVGWPNFGQGGHRFELRAVGRFPAREMEGEREADGITETMNFTGEPAPRAAKSLLASPPFAPAAEMWPRTVVESML